jgi:hypothetical protein
MSSFLDLAAEPFSGVISLLDTHEWTALWLSGDSKMQWKLGKGRAVKEMTLNWSRFSPCRWPSQIAHLDGLESFTLSRYSCITSRPLPDHHLSTLSQNLRKMSLVFGGPLEALDALFRPLKLPNLHTLELSYINDENMKTQFWCLQPSLTSP